MGSHLTKEDEKIVDRAIDYMELTKMQNQFIDELSGGQRQRAYIAMVIAQDTEYVLLDEPTNNLDIYHSTNMMKIVRRLCDELGKTVTDSFRLFTIKVKGDKTMCKIFSVLLAGVMMISMAVCGNTANNDAASSDTTAQRVTLTTKNGAGEMVEIDFPSDPKRLAVMDLGALDILDNIGYGERIVGVSKGSSIDYLQDYLANDALLYLGTVKEADMEALMESEPDIIFIGGRMSAMYDELVKIAPVYMVYTDTQIGVVESTAVNAKNIASLFGAEDKVDELMADYSTRIDALKAVAEGKTAIVGMVNAGGFGLLGNDGRCSIIGREIGFENVGVDADVDTSSHGNEASFEFVLSKNPDYIFAMDRDAAIGTEGARLAAEVLDNELIHKTDAAQNGNVIVLEHSNVWYTAEGGITALGVMLSDLEGTLLRSSEEN